MLADLPTEHTLGVLLRLSVCPSVASTHRALSGLHTKRPYPRVVGDGFCARALRVSFASSVAQGGRAIHDDGEPAQPACMGPSAQGGLTMVNGLCTHEELAPGQRL